VGFGRRRRRPRLAPRRASVLPRADTHDGPRYSVVIPAFNEQAYLGACLASLAAQDYPGTFEVIVVDNNSTDDTPVIAAAAGVTIVVEPERGVCQARQRGTEAAHGEIIISTDADTTFTPGWLSGIDAAFARHPGAVAVAGPCHFAGAPRWGNLYSTLLFGTVNLVKRVTGRVVYVSATNIAFRSSAWTGYDTRLTQGGDELDLLRRLQAAGEVVFDITNPTRTSSRRLDEGLLYNVAVTFLYYYLLGYALNRTFRRPVLGTAPPFRRTGDRGTRTVTSPSTRSWRMTRAAFLLEDQPPD
jgi:glycosyltransferase involved in cell wall biosynthesis